MLVSLSGCSSEPSAPSTGTDAIIIAAQTHIESQPQDIQGYLILAQAYLQKVRETADTSLYQKVEEAMQQAEKVDPDNPEIFTMRATVAAGKHDFRTARDLSAKAVSLNPSIARSYAVLADAQVELGQYEEAVDTLETMVNTRPDFSSYSRISHVRELHGDTEGAIEAMQRAIAAGAAFPENIAWARVELGKLFFPTDLAKAAEQYTLALESVPNYPRALQGIGRVAAAEGRNDEALVHFQKAFDLLSIAEHGIDLGDMHMLMGNTDKANQLYTIVTVGFNQFEKGGTNIDLERAFFLADHDRDLLPALEKAKTAYQTRPSIDAADTLAWALLKNGQAKEAQMYSEESLRLGTQSAQFHYHAGMIALANGKNEEAKKELETAFEINPHFSLLEVNKARATLSSL